VAAPGGVEFDEGGLVGVEDRAVEGLGVEDCYGGGEGGGEEGEEVGEDADHGGGGWTRGVRISYAGHGFEGLSCLCSIFCRRKILL
jgi:hypothetical protein